MSISTKILIWLASVAAAFIGGYFINSCGSFHAPELINSEIIIRDTVTQKVYLGNIETQGHRIITPEVIIPVDDTLSSTLINQIDSALDKLDLMNVSIIYRDTILTAYNDQLMLSFNLTKRKFGDIELFFGERNIPVEHKTIIPTKGVLRKAWYEDPLVIGIISGVLGFALGILVVAG